MKRPPEPAPGTALTAEHHQREQEQILHREGALVRTAARIAYPLQPGEEPWEVLSEHSAEHFGRVGRERARFWPAARLVRTCSLMIRSLSAEMSRISFIV
jgi:hypothetical protein